MSRFLKYLDDENFIRWICDNDQEEILDNDAEKQHFASILKKILKELNIKEARLSPAERDEILNLLLKEIESSPNPSLKVVAKNRLTISLIRYAAAALILLGVGAGLYLLLPQKEDTYTKYFSQDKPVQPNNTTQLILADGRIIDIDSKNASIQYDKDKIIINRKDTISLNEGKKEPSGRLSKDGEITSSSSALVFNHIVTPYGRTAQLTLPDGSSVHLNAGTQFKYPSIFSAFKREVVLKGEAYFEVARNEQKPFIVNANDQAIIRVLGTHFNVSAYEDENSVKTTLVEGSVKVLSKISGRSLQISPGQQVDMDAEGGLNMKKVNTEEYTSWIDGVFLFDKESFSSVLKKVERYYNIRFAFGDPSKGDIKISGKLNLKTELEEIIEVLQTTSSTSINSIKGGYYVIK